MELLSDLLPARVGSPLSVNALREDLEVSHRAVSHWLDVLERLYFLFRVPPFATRRVRALHKPNKVYVWDWSLVDAPGPRFENLIASHLLKLCHWLEDVEGFPVRLHYLRDTAQREVDFLVTAKNNPWFAVEAKLDNGEPSPHLRYFGERLAIPHLYQVTLQGDRDQLRGGIRVVPAAKFLAATA
jgi:predicted AAA+ superfamily ATPase